MKIVDHRLKPHEIKFIETNKTSGTFAEGLPDTIIIHYTAGPSAESAINAFTNSDIQASAHAVIARDGDIIQLVPFNIIAWHAGQSEYVNRTGFNKYAIGIEIVNAGRLQKVGSEYVAWFEKSYPDRKVIKATHRNEDTPSYWHRYSAEQIKAVYDLCWDLIQEYDIERILGHSEISPGRKSDPGPAFPLDKLRERLLYGDGSDTDLQEIEQWMELNTNTAVVTASMLNIRSGPSASESTIANPLPKNTRVNIVDESGEWVQVETVISGWVHGDYIDKTPD